MVKLQIESVLDPLDDPRLFQEGIEALKLGDAMGLLAGEEVVRRLDLDAIRRVARSAARAGIASSAAATLARPKPGPAALRRALATLLEALEESPVPSHEWRSLGGIFEVGQLAALLGISVSSLRRYAAGSRATPDDVAARLHFLAKVVADLLGAYNEVGIRRWFERRRATLRGRSPAQALSGAWDPDDEGPEQVRALARSLAGASAT